MLSRGLAVFALLLPGLAPAAPFSWDVPEVTWETRVEGEVKVDGVPVHLHVAISRWDVARLVQHFATRFDEAGLFIAPGQRSPLLTAFDPKAGRTFTVLFQPGPGRRTTVVLGTADFRRQARPSRPDFAPIFPGATRAVRSEDEGARMLSFQVEATPKALRDFYAQTLGEAGYRSTAQDVYTRAEEELALAFRTLPDAPGRLHVLLFWRRNPAPPAGLGRFPGQAEGGSGQAERRREAP